MRLLRVSEGGAIDYTCPVRVVRHLRSTVALFLTVAPLLFLGSPLCFSEACPMSAAQRAACKNMGRECCGTRGGLSKAPAAPAPVLASLPVGPAVAVPILESTSLGSSSRPFAAPATIQGVGLFTLFAVFLI
jgi:hypothetical protein